MKDRKWWNTWWRSADPQSTPVSRHSLDLSESPPERAQAPRAQSTPPRQEEEEAIANISFSFLNEPAAASREMDGTTVVVGEHSTLVLSKKSPNISCINILSINTGAKLQENTYASPTTTISVNNPSPVPLVPTSPPPDSPPSPDAAYSTLEESTAAKPSTPNSSSQAESPVTTPSSPTSQDVTFSTPEECTLENPSSPTSTVLLETLSTPTFQDASPDDSTAVNPSSPTITEPPESTVTTPTTPSFQDATSTPEDSTAVIPPSPTSTIVPDSPLTNPSSPTLQDGTISTPEESTAVNPPSSPPTDLPDCPLTAPSSPTAPASPGSQDWETITEYSDYYVMGGKENHQKDSDYEYCEPGRRRATLMRKRRRGLRSRIRRAWWAVRGWWSDERLRIGEVIQKHAHAQAVKQTEEEHKEDEVKIPEVRKLDEVSRPSSRAGLRRSRYIPEVIEGQNGFEELRRYIKQGGDFCKDLSSILQERSEAETQYAKSLSKLSGKLLKASKDSVGTVNQAWQRAGTQMEAQSEIHRAFATALSEEVVKPLRQLVEAQHRIRKSVESAVDKTGKSLSEWRSAEGKSKKQSFLSARENEKMQDAMLDVRLGRASSTTHLHVTTAGHGQQGNKDKESAKLEAKRRKAEEAVKKADVEYYTFSLRAERARLEWETAVIRGSHCFQALEEERLQHLKDLAACYLNHLQEMGPKLVQSVERLREPVESCDVARDIQTVVSIKGTGQPIPEQLLPDFYAEHITLAMNRDRRRQALVKLLQLIRQDLDRERRGKQGVENLARALQQTPTFGAEDSQQNVTEKLHHMRSMLTYLEAMRYKVHSALAELDGRARGGHPLAAHIQVTRDRQGLQQSILKVPPWVREESLDRLAGDSPDWTDRGTADGNSVQPDSDFDEFSSQGSEKDYQSSVLTQCPVITHETSVPPVDAAPSIGQCRALYEYTANLYDELNLQPGDVIKIHDKQADGWWLGELNGVVGIFPATYVQEID